MDEDEAGCPGIGGRKEIPFVALTWAVGQIEMPRTGVAEGLGGRDALGRQRVPFGYGAAVVVRGVARGAAHSSPVHSAASPPQSPPPPGKAPPTLGLPAGASAYRGSGRGQDARRASG